MMLRLRGTVYFEADFRPLCGMAILSKDVAAFRVVASGECWPRGAGASAVVDRLAEAILLQTLRLYLDHTCEPRGFLAAVRDRRIGPGASRRSA